MMTELTVHTDFQTRLMDRVKESIGDLITDTDLKSIVEKGIYTAFFEPTYTKDNYGGLKITQEPLVTKIVKECLTEQVNLAVKEYFATKPEEVQAILDTVIREGITKVVLSTFDSKLERSMWAMRDSIVNNLRSMS